VKKPLGLRKGALQDAYMMCVNPRVTSWSFLVLVLVLLVVFVLVVVFVVLVVA
jgi:hypothetical protein